MAITRSRTLPHENNNSRNITNSYRTPYNNHSKDSTRNTHNKIIVVVIFIVIITRHRTLSKNHIGIG